MVPVSCAAVPLRPATIVAPLLLSQLAKLLNGSASTSVQAAVTTADAMIPALGSQIADHNPAVGGDLLRRRGRVLRPQFQARGAVDGGACSGGERGLAGAEPQEVDLGADGERGGGVARQR